MSSVLRGSLSDTEELYTIAMEVGEVFKSKLGEQRFATKLAECQKAAVIKTEERKRKVKVTAAVSCSLTRLEMT